jgi:UDP-N-acetylmuramoyl-L-alanyl-D-glutamate--2,6-diaminopimelate ligase
MADRIVLTDEESYSEDPEAIRAEVRRGVETSGGDGHMDEIADRREAIKKAFIIARPGDTVAITGMGHEKFRIMGDQKLPWNDTDVARELLMEKLKKS